ncbi:MAG TPA: fumarylacetoacetate hydrolase family protein [Nitrososphaeraceae archaeon]|jgi:2-keto-4-pentenoate hydratase/2-oxohepta-3-ene-1,7-dioic acid hydratase in catechol pathway|nr:fumarylacetoacetate hydrolase family protein [Nitrososphaeraceae archaeon]
MKIGRIKKQEVGETYGIISPDGNRIITKLDFQEQTGIPIPQTIKEFVVRGWIDEVKKYISDIKFSNTINNTDLLAPIPDPPKIICLAFNYYDHARDAGLTPSDEPVIFIKPRTTLNHPFNDVVCPYFVERLDYEAELAIIIGKNTKDIEPERASDCIFGYTILHDVSARDIQFKDKQFTRGKSFDTFAPCGPWITTKDEINDPQNLQIVTKVNGEIRQNSSSSKMVISIENVVSSLSKIMTLEAGDIISTGTPAGVAMSMKEPKYLRNGDVVEITIENLGTIRNRITFA